MTIVQTASRIPPKALLDDYAMTAEGFPTSAEGYVRLIIQGRCRLTPSESVLDLGCGPGPTAIVLADYLSDEGRYEGIDIMPSVIEFCAAAYADKPNFGFQLADIHSSHYNPGGRQSASNFVFPYDDASFDFIFSASLFTHLLPEEVENYCREMARVLKPGGRCMTTAFLLNEESRATMQRDDLPVAYRFNHGSGTARYLNADNVAQAVAHDEAWMRRTFLASDMRISELTFGTWAGQPDLLGALQDLIVAIRV